jgi:hypothetical protein
MTNARARRASRPLTWSLLSSLVALFGACSCRGGDDDDPGGDPEDFYALKLVPDLELRLAPGARESLAKQPREWVPAELGYRGKTWKDVRVKLKGHRSLRTLKEKPSFKVRFDGKKFLGQKSLTLNNMVEDPTSLREALGYRLYRELGVPAPDTGYARVTVDGEPYGLYLLLETVDKDFLERRFGDDKGAVYEGAYGCDLYPEDVAGFELDAGDDDRPALAALAAAASGPVDRLIGGEGSRLDDSALAYLAVSAFLGDFDGYRHAHNYRLYHRPDVDRWYFIPWGIDRVFFKRLGPYDSNGLVAKRCFADHDCRIRYLETLGRVVAAFEKLRLDQGVNVIGQLIAEATPAVDPHNPHSRDKVGTARARLRRFIAERPVDVSGALGCLEGNREVDRDGDGFGCMDCDDRDPAVHPGAAELDNDRDDDCSGLVDDNPAFPCEAIEAGGARFELCDLPLVWADAERYCAARGGALARIDSLEQSAAIYREAKKLDDEERWWIGLSDRIAEGEFRWADGSPAGPGAPWSKGQPDNGSCNQDCAALRKDGDGTWHDAHCGQPYPFVCRMEPGPLHNPAAPAAKPPRAGNP